MYRRITGIEQYTRLNRHRKDPMSSIGGAFHFMDTVEIAFDKTGRKPHSAWSMPAPRKAKLPMAARFFFTEAGWKKFGKHILADIMAAGVQVRILSVKQRRVDVVYKDRWQVAAVKRKHRYGKRQEGF